MVRAMVMENDNLPWMRGFFLAAADEGIGCIVLLLITSWLPVPPLDPAPPAPPPPAAVAVAVAVVLATVFWVKARVAVAVVIGTGNVFSFAG